MFTITDMVNRQSCLGAILVTMSVNGLCWRSNKQDKFLIFNLLFIDRSSGNTTWYPLVWWSIHLLYPCMVQVIKGESWCQAIPSVHCDRRASVPPLGRCCPAFMSASRSLGLAPHFRLHVWEPIRTCPPLRLYAPPMNISITFWLIIIFYWEFKDHSGNTSSFYGPTRLASKIERISVPFWECPQSGLNWPGSILWWR